MKNEIIEITDNEILTNYKNSTLPEIIKKVSVEISLFEHDMSTVESRARTRALSAKVTKLKVRITSFLKETVNADTERLKVIKAESKKLIDFSESELMEISKIARLPLTEYENVKNEEKRIKKEAIELEILNNKLIVSHLDAIIINNKFDIDKSIEIEKEKNRIIEIEKIKLIEIEKIKKQAKIDAENKIKIDAELALSNERMLKENAINDALKVKLDAENRVKQAKIDADNIIKQASIKAELAEKARLDNEALIASNIEKEKERLLSDRNNLIKICTSAKNDLIKELDIDNSLAVKIIKKIKSNKISFININLNVKF